MNILDNELVRKYFGDDNDRYHYTTHHADVKIFECRMAERVLLAMQEPIRKGQLYLATYENNHNFKLETKTTDFVNDDPYHPYELRLPDRFQNQCSCGQSVNSLIHEGNCSLRLQRQVKPCDGNGCNCSCHPQPTLSDEVEDLIKYLLSVSDHSSDWEIHLRELVRLAREK